MPNQDQVDQAMQRDLEAVGIRVKFQISVMPSLHATPQRGPGRADAHATWGSYSVFDADGILWDKFH